MRRHLELAAKSSDPRQCARKTQIGEVVSALAAASLDIAERFRLARWPRPLVARRTNSAFVRTRPSPRPFAAAGVRAFLSTEADETLGIDDQALSPWRSILCSDWRSRCEYDRRNDLRDHDAGGEDEALPAGEPLAAGFVVYGPQTALALTLGDGVDIFIHDRRDRSWRLTAPAVRIPEFAHEYAINAANYRHWNAAVRAFVDDCFNGWDSDEGTTLQLMLDGFHRRGRLHHSHTRRRSA